MILRGPTQIYQSVSIIALRVTFAFRNEPTRYTNYAKLALRMRWENKKSSGILSGIHITTHHPHQPPGLKFHLGNIFLLLKAYLVSPEIKPKL